MKLEQWNNTGKFGATIQGIADYSLATDSIFGEDVHVVFRRNNDGGTMDLFVNGAFVEQHGAKTNWRMDGGVGTLGANWNNNADFATGDMFGVASYDVALSDAEIGNLYAAYAVAVPEPSSTALLGLGGLALILRRRK
ncbi:PEP-CTERM sorting domain-containing protein [Sulfuriroseicoccus oceanibius]|uniref:PEP-CTERM sorting domain-containing protein n=2 Tax=Sulfuriroseicoccus oceanibius TaxID=2707525 RepID=A0A6B3L828_9BACT|nr:PEP-CTERM sorting domain-containing protein [Sulfuriroseicoccus oceanibius]